MSAFDDLTDDAVQAKQQAQAGMAVQFGAQANPDQAAEHAALAKRYGLPTSVVEEFPDEFKTRAKVDDARAVVAQSPTLQSWLASNPDNAKVAHDDLHTLSAMEQLYGVAKAPYEAAKGLGGSFNKLAGSINLALGGVPTLYDKAASVFTGQDQTGASDWWFRNLVDPLLQKQKQFEVSPNASAPEKLANMTGGLLGMLSQITLTGGAGEAPAAAATVPQVLGHAVETATKTMAFPAISEAIDTGRRVYAETGNAEQALHAAEMAYGTTTAMGVVPLSTPGGVWSRLATGAASGVATGEASREAMNLVLPLQMQQPFDVEQAIYSAITGGALGGVMGPRPEPAYHEAIRQTYTDAAKAQQAEQDFANLSALGQVASASKLRERDPEAFKQFVQSVTDDGQLNEVYIDGKTFGDVLNQSGVTPDQLAKTLPDVAEQLREAIATGGDVRIPVSDYATHIAGGPVDVGILPHLKTTPDGMTYQQGQEFYQGQKKAMEEQAAKIVEQKAQDDAYQADVKTLEDNLFGQMQATGRFTDDVSRASIVPLKSYYVTRAEQLGMKPSELYAKFPVKITAERLFGGGLEQFAGPNAQTADTHALTTAQQRIAAGADAETVRKETGWFKGPDNKWRYEISDADAKLKKPWPSKAQLFKDVYVDVMNERLDDVNWNLKVGDILEHPSLFAAYPELANIIVDYKSGKGASLLPPQGIYPARIQIGADEPMYEVRSLLMHEVQHAIQEHEGFARGGSLNTAGVIKAQAKNEWDYWSNVYTLKREMEGGLRLPVDKAVEALNELGFGIEAEHVADAQRYTLEELKAKNDAAYAELQRTGDGPYETYRRLAGEVEARNTQARAKMTDAERSATPPEQTADVPSSDVIVVFNGKVMESAPPPANALPQGTRGAFSPDTNTIALLKDADLSTFLHETGHFFLEADAQLAAMPDAPQQIKDDFNTVLKWFGVKDAETWNAMSLEQKREHHEQFARGFEAYLFEGKAPNMELQGVFSRFRSWMLRVYRDIRGLGVQLNDEVRGVFDRMLASEDAIRQAETARGYVEPPFTPEQLKAAGVDPEQFRSLGAEATQNAVDDMQRRSLKDMQWLTNAKSKALRKLQREADAKREAIREEVTKEVMDEPINQARTFLKTGEINREPGNRKERRALEAAAGMSTKLDLGALKDMYGDGPAAPWRYLSTGTHGLATVKDGLHPDIVADIFGFSSGDHLVRALLDAEDPQVKIEGMTDQRMLERHGELVDPQSIERAAEAAIHNDARARFLATGLKVLTKSPLPVQQIKKAAREAARAAIAAKRVRDLRPAQYLAAEAKANREVLKLAAKSPEKAVEAQRAALLNNQLAKEAQAAIDEVAKGVEYLKRLEGSSAQNKMRGEFLGQLNALLDRFDLRTSRTLTSIDSEREALAKWIESEADRLSAVMPDMPAWVLDEAYRTSYKSMTMEQFRGLLDSVRQLEKLARREQEQYMAIRGMQFADERQQILDRIRTAYPDAFDGEGKPKDQEPDFVPSIKKAAGKLGDSFTGEFLGAETILNILEGGEFGQVEQSLFGRMSERSSWKASRLEGIYKDLKPLYDAYSLKEKAMFGRRGYYIPEIGTSLTRENMVSVALLHGSADGRERLMNYGWDEAKQRAIIQRLEARDLDLVQAVWKLFDENLWPELKQLNEHTRGKAPPKVEALPYRVNGRDMTGGYYRLKYDTALDERAHRLDEGAAVKELLGGGMGMSSKTNQGTSTERKQNVTMRPRLDLGVLAEAVNETVHDLAYREAVADTIRLLNDKGVMNAIKSVVGTPGYRALVTRVREVAAPPRNPSGFIEKSLAVARKNTIVTLMSGVKTALQNFTGLVPAFSRVDAGLLTKELGKFFSPKMLDRAKFVMEQSEYMRHRYESFDRDLQDMTKKLSVKARIMPDTAVFLGLMGYVDRAVSIPVWNAAFKEGMNKFKNDTHQAVQYADHIVRQTQGSGRDVDLPKIMSGHGGYGQLKRVFTMFYSYFNGQLQMLVRAGAVSRIEARDNPALAAAKFTGQFMLVAVIPAVLTEMAFGSRDDNNPDAWLGRYAHALAMYGAAMFPIVRDLASFVYASFDHDVRNYGYKITPIQSAGEGVVKGAVAVKNIASGEGEDKDTKNLIMGTSFALGLPGKLISDVTMGTKAWLNDEAGPEAVVIGPPKK